MIRFVTGCAILLASTAIVTAEDAAPATPPAVKSTLHVDVAQAKTLDKFNSGDACALAKITKDKKSGKYSVNLTDSAGKKPANAKGTIEETDALASADAKGVEGLTWKISDIDKTKGTVTLTSTDALPAKK